MEAISSNSDHKYIWFVDVLIKFLGQKRYSITAGSDSKKTG